MSASPRSRASNAQVAAPAKPSVSRSTASHEPMFERDVRPILKRHCFQCHGEDKQEAKLDVRLRRLIATGGDSVSALVEGKPDESLLWRRIAADEMPPEEVKARLTAAERRNDSRWIVAGAKTARPEPADLAAEPLITEEERSHLVVSTGAASGRAASEAGRSRADADRCVRAAEARSTRIGVLSRGRCRDALPSAVLRPDRPAADAGGGRRRSSPTHAPDAYEKLVDRLLASPHYGERWGRHWLDVAGLRRLRRLHDDRPGARPYA